jgi:arylsulfatase A-like enzyme
VLDRLRAHLGKEPLRFEDRYRAEVMALDDEVGRIWKALERLGLRGETVVLVTADHGEVLDRRHCFFLPRLKYNTCYSHSTSPYDEVLRVPLLLAGAGVPAGKVVTQITRHVDLVPTVLTLMGVPPLPGAMGVSVLPQVRGERPDEARDVYAAGRGIYALRRGTWKIIYRDAATRDIVDGGRKRSVTMELYDLAADPAEHRNLAGTEKVRTEAMFRELLGYMAKDRVVLPPYLKKKLSESR